MRIVNFMTAGGPRLGYRISDQVLPLNALAPELPDDLTQLFSLGPELSLKLTEAIKESDRNEALPLASLDLLPPILAPGKIICLGINYDDHASESGLDKPEFPVLFLRTAASLVAHGKAIEMPKVSESLDFEGELVAFIGKQGKHITVGNALSHVAGYAIFNDGSIRDYQFKTPQWTAGKNFDRTGAFGPEFVSADEVPRGASGLTIETWLNGERVQHANTSNMIFDVANTIAILSSMTTLEPGDVLVMGTPAGVGAARTPPLYMKEGDVVEVSIEMIGTLSNFIRKEK